jgi:hypothetical protein
MLDPDCVPDDADERFSGRVMIEMRWVQNAIRLPRWPGNGEHAVSEEAQTG